MDTNHIYIGCVVATYWFISICIVYLNKILLSSESFSVAAPLFVTWFQCIITAFICYCAGLIGEKARFYQTVAQHNSTGNSKDNSDSSSKLIVEFFTQFPKADFRCDVAKRVSPFSVIFVAMITFNNLCLMWVEVSFYNIARSLTIVFNVIFTSVLLGASIPTPRIINCLGFVLFGFILGSEGELMFSMKGTLAGILSSVFVSLNAIYTKKILPVVDDDHWRLTFYNNVNAAFMLLPMMLYFERSAILNAMDAQFQSLLFWFCICVTGFFGFSIGIVTVQQIKATSPLVHNISGTAKALVQSLLAFYLWGNEATWLGLFGIFAVLGGNLWYTVLKMREGNVNKAFHFANNNNEHDNNNNNSNNVHNIMDNSNSNHDNIIMDDDLTETTKTTTEMQEIKPLLAKV